MDFKEITDKIQSYGRSWASYWGCALAGEVGEACNLVKKYERDWVQSEDTIKLKESFKEPISLELADVFISTILLAKHFNIDLEQAILKKLEINKKRREDRLTRRDD